MFDKLTQIIDIHLNTMTSDFILKEARLILED
jgi:hypothetical protein